MLARMSLTGSRCTGISLPLRESFLKLLQESLDLAFGKAPPPGIHEQSAESY
jgi:hypothetical protein